jgi:hypothetical protein
MVKAISNVSGVTVSMSHTPDGLVEVAARNALADRFGPCDPTALAHIRWPEGPMALVIAHRHPIAASPAHDEPLQ